MALDNSFLKHWYNTKCILIGLTDDPSGKSVKAMYLIWLDTHLCVPRTCYCDDTSNSGLVVALVEHATKGKKHAEKVALCRYLHSIKLKIMLNVYELLFSILIWIFYYLFVWEMRHLHTGGSCPVVSGQGDGILTVLVPRWAGSPMLQKLCPIFRFVM